MKQSALRPRLNQISELTRGVHLPLPMLEREHLEIILEVLHEALKGLIGEEEHTTTFKSGTEAEINALMDARLRTLLLQVDQEPIWRQLWRQMVATVARGAETVSYDGTHLEKRPDLNLYLTSRRDSFPLVIECKLIDAPDSKGPKLYCDNGVVRFLSGEYAWANREAIMLAYVRDKSSIITALMPVLTTSQSEPSNPYSIQNAVSPVGLLSLDVAYSVHARNFQYPTRSDPDNRPGPITIWHLWMLVS